MKRRQFKKLARRGIPLRSKETWNRAFNRRHRQWPARSYGPMMGPRWYPVLDHARELRRVNLSLTGRLLGRLIALRIARAHWERSHGIGR